MPDRSDKFTERARSVLALAQEEAQRFNHNNIGTEHILLGLLREGDSIAAKVLTNLGVELDKVRSAVEFIIGRGDQGVGGEIGVTPQAKRVIELAVEEANRLNHSYIGTEHLLLGLVREGEGIAFGVLESFGVNLERVRTGTTRILSQALPTDTLEPSARLAPSDALRARADNLLKKARDDLLSYRANAVEQTLLYAFVIPKLGFFRDSLERHAQPGRINEERTHVLTETGPIRGLADAFRERGDAEMSQTLFDALDALREALSD